MSISGDSLAAIAEIEHDLRQPLQSLSLLQATLAGKLGGPREQEMLADMGRAIDSLSEMLSNLTMVAKIDSGRIVPCPALVPVAALLNEAAASYRDAAHHKGLEIRVVPCAAVLKTDADLAGRVVSALVSNAVAFTETGRVLLGARRQRKGIRIEVWDSGAGIAADVGPRIYERFYSEDPASTGRAPHIGLGLAVARDLASCLNFELTMRSWPGRGSVFAVSCPQSVLAGSEVESVSADGGNLLAGRKVMVAGNGEIGAALGDLFARWRAVVDRVDDPSSLGGEPVGGGHDLIVLIVPDDGASAGITAALRRHGGRTPLLIAGRDASALPERGRLADGVEILTWPASGGKIRALAAHLLSRRVSSA